MSRWLVRICARRDVWEESSLRLSEPVQKMCFSCDLKIFVESVFNDVLFKCQEGTNSSLVSDYYMTKRNKSDLFDLYVIELKMCLFQWHRLGGGGAMGAASLEDPGEGPSGSQDCGPGGHQGMSWSRNEVCSNEMIHRSLTKQVFPSSSWRTRTLK